MSKLTIVECHNLTNYHVKERLNSYFFALKQENQGIVDKADISWNGNDGYININAIGLNFRGSIRVEDEFVTVKGELPPIAAEYYLQIEEILRYRIYRLLN